MAVIEMSLFPFSKNKLKPEAIIVTAQESLLNEMKYQRNRLNEIRRSIGI